MQLMKKPSSMHGDSCDCSKCMADGGPVLPGAQNAQDSMRKAFKFSHGGKVKGIHEEQGHGYSKAGAHASFAKELDDKDDPEYGYARKKHNDEARGLHVEKLSELKAMPNPKLKGLAHGGEVESEDHEMHEIIGPEMMDAIHSKDHKKLMSGIEAMVLHHMNKKED